MKVEEIKKHIYDYLSQLSFLNDQMIQATNFEISIRGEAFSDSVKYLCEHVTVGAQLNYFVGILDGETFYFAFHGPLSAMGHDAVQLLIFKNFYNE